MRQHLKEVGGPIDMVRIDKTGVTWIQRKPECVEEEVTSKTTEALGHSF
jgi:hypothetical protein